MRYLFNYYRCIIRNKLYNKKIPLKLLNLETEKSARTVVLPDAANFEAGDSEESYFIGKADDGSEKVTYSPLPPKVMAVLSR